ncbi:MAG: c-type cytochrome [Acidobacteriota bacterium]|nr:c-type cytochrome [Acidobacteriota bacterium]
MKLHKFFACAGVTSLTVLMLPTAFAQKRWDAPRIITWNCSGCHGVDGNAQPPYLPRLAGLDSAYAARRIAEFRATAAPHVDELLYQIIAPHSQQSDPGRREARINMIGIAYAMSPEQIKSSTAWYAIQTPKTGRDGDSALVDEGKLLYLKGMPAQGMPACQTCHGVQAEGKSTVPRLAGQNGSYILREMAKFKVGDRQHAPEMSMVAGHVDIEQFRALAAYLQSR